MSSLSSLLAALSLLPSLYLLICHTLILRPTYSVINGVECFFWSRYFFLVDSTLFSNIYSNILLVQAIFGLNFTWLQCNLTKTTRCGTKKEIHWKIWFCFYFIIIFSIYQITGLNSLLAGYIYGLWIAIIFQLNNCNNSIFLSSTLNRKCTNVNLFELLLKGK